LEESLQDRSGNSLSVEFKIPFYRHGLGEAEIESIRDVLDQPILTTGSFVREFEETFAEYLGCKYVVGVTSCTAAIHLSLLAMEVGAGDEVITTPLTFVATATAILQAGATPVFVDVESDTGNIDVDQVAKKVSKRTKAIVPVHLYGQMVDMIELSEFCSTRGIRIVEDAAHCVGGSRQGVHPAELSSAACFSFYATKHLTSGEGGAVATNEKVLYDKLCVLRYHGMTRDADERSRVGYKDWDMSTMGWKYNMSNIDAGLLLPQLSRLDSNLTKLRLLAEKYAALLKNISSITMPTIRKTTVHARHLFPILIEAMPRQLFIDGMHARGIGVVVNYRPVHLTSYFSGEYKYSKGDFPAAEVIGEKVVSLPLFPSMSTDDVKTVVDAVIDTIGAS